MATEVVRAGAPRREFLGLASLPDGPPRGALWILCNPFGQDAVRSKPLYRTVAERLSRHGCAVLRFDYHGTGDSPGELRDQTLASWVGDTLAADDWMRRRFPGAALPVCWFGLRLGGTVAAMAALRAEPRPDRLLLWDPILDGPGYTASLRARHRDLLCAGLGRSWPKVRRLTGETEPALPGYVLGYEIGPALAAEFDALGPLPLAALLQRGVRVDCALESSRIGELPAADGPGLRRIRIDTPIDWTSTEAFGTVIVPQEVLRAALEAQGPA